MSIILKKLRLFFIASLALILLMAATLIVALNQGWLTPVINHYAAPWHIKAGDVRLEGLPLALNIETLQIGRGTQALQLDYLELRTTWSSLFAGEPEFYFRAGDGQLGYSQKDSAWQLAGLTVTQWQQLFSSNAAQAKNTPGPAESSLEVSLQSLELKNFRLISGQPGLPDVALNRLLAGPWYSTQTQKAVALQLDAETAGGHLIAEGRLRPDKQQPELHLQTELKDVTLNARWLKWLPEPLSTRINSQLDWQIRPVTEQTLFPLQLQLTGGLTLDDTRWQQADMLAEAHRIVLDDWQIRLQADPVSDQPFFVWQADGHLLLEQFFAQQQTRRVQLQALELQQLALTADGNPEQPASARIDVALDSLRLSGVSAEQSVHSIRLAQLLLKNLSAQHLSTGSIAASIPDSSITELTLTRQSDQETPDLTLENFSLKELTLLTYNTEQWLLQTGKQNIRMLELVQSTLNYRLNRAELDSLQLWRHPDGMRIDAGLLRLADGTADYRLPKRSDAAVRNSAENDDVTEDQEPDAPEMTQAAASETPSAVQLSGAGVLLTSHALSFRDMNIPERPLTGIDLQRLSLQALQWPAETALPWKADFWLNGQSHWQLTGTVQPQPLEIALKGKQTGMNLPDLTPYSRHYADIVFNAGTMNNQIDLSIAADRLQGTLGFTLQKPEIELQGALSKQNLPLKMAFSVLKDSDDTVELSIDLDKTGDDLQLDTSAIVKEFIVSASKKGAVSYLKYMLQPYGTLMTLADLGSKALQSGHIPLEPILFEHLQADLSNQQLGYAYKIRKLLAEKKHLRLHYCLQPSADEKQRLAEESDSQEALTLALNDLNQQRLNQWRRAFAEHNLASRLNSCNAEAEPLTEGKSRLQLSLQP